ncbi:hypothetical protein GH714_005364 [Hevea brasiliensis]|uniref:Retrotransposon gag domain-containing protein n=1 Tax=Hevea brasiliensis TaxID=3981 RepID=A0A6A6MBH3_HEVBR|nr:hypothetical protein GH714_005364 [Hevea brasiliensis]
MEDDICDDEEMDFMYVAGQGQGKGSQNFQQHYRRDDEFKLNMDIPTFSGDLDIEGFVDWLIEVDHFFEYAEILEERKGYKSVNEYTAEFLRLVARNHLFESDNQQAT